jgi:GT2 family glycosyltransferase
MCCNGKALQNCVEVFDSDFFLYKEDIELSLRLRKLGWSLLYDPRLTAYHCRGWNSRNNMSRALRIVAAESEVLLYKKHPSPFIVWAFLKLMAVKLARL